MRESEGSESHTQKRKRKSGLFARKRNPRSKERHDIGGGSKPLFKGSLREGGRVIAQTSSIASRSRRKISVIYLREEQAPALRKITKHHETAFLFSLPYGMKADRRRRRSLQIIGRREANRIDYKIRSAEALKPLTGKIRRQNRRTATNKAYKRTSSVAGRR